MIRYGIIYSLRCKETGKIYIGQTLQKPKNRLRDHFSHRFDKVNINKPLYQDMIKYGIDNFEFMILEDNIAETDLDLREIYYISLYNSYRSGYNLTIGGQHYEHHTKLSSNDVSNIIDLLHNSAYSMHEIADFFDVDCSSISAINLGESYYQNNLTYPIRESINKKKNFSETDLSMIYAMLKTNNYRLKDIADKFNTSIQTIQKINKGIIYHNPDLSYPIKTESVGTGAFTIVKYKQIIDYLINTNISLRKLESILNVERHTLSYINNGTMGYDKVPRSLGYDKFPLRTNYKVYSG